MRRPSSAGHRSSPADGTRASCACSARRCRPSTCAAPRRRGRLAGDVYTAEVVADLGALSLPPDRAPARTLLVGDALEDLAAELDADVISGDGTDGIVSTSAERAVIP